ncbi:hypothetical protein C8F01DRAFT_1079420 [Mycena amicta]|nr:hypothetical protein C8F01DRAFT_1079420 [Mycena amicta]
MAAENLGMISRIGYFSLLIQLSFGQISTAAYQPGLTGARVHDADGRVNTVPRIAEGDGGLWINSTRDWYNLSVGNYEIIKSEMWSIAVKTRQKIGRVRGKGEKSEAPNSPHDSDSLPDNSADRKTESRARSGTLQTMRDVAGYSAYSNVAQDVVPAQVRRDVPVFR